MRKLLIAASVWVCVMGFGSITGRLNAADGPNLVVDDDKVQCPTAAFTKIQDAVNAAPAGATIRVCAGTYNEQVSINKNIEIRGDNGAIVLPSNVMANTTSLVTNAPIAAAILVSSADKVTLENLTVDGANNGITGCGPTLIGIFFRNASGRVSHVAVRNMKLAASLNGCQSGLGIFVQSANGTTARAEIEDSSVHDFQKNGITGNESGTEVEVRGNVVTGLGPTTGAAQNGIQIGFGARGAVTNNSISNLVWSPCVSTSVCDATASGILVFNSDDVTIQRNSVSVTQGGIFVQGGHGEIEGNIVFDTLIFDGIALVGDQNEAQRNSVTDSAESAVSIQGNNNIVTENQINEAPIGVLKVTGSTGNTISKNQFFNTPVPVQDPSEVASVKSRQAYR
jgi:nitrous oxidase accessory protein NosD